MLAEPLIAWLLDFPIRHCAGRSSATSWVYRPTSGMPRGHALRSKASAGAFSRSRTPTANGPVAHSSPQTSTFTALRRLKVGSPGQRRPGH